MKTATTKTSNETAKQEIYEAYRTQLADKTRAIERELRNNLKELARIADDQDHIIDTDQITEAADHLAEAAAALDLAIITNMNA